MRFWIPAKNWLLHYAIAAIFFGSIFTHISAARPTSEMKRPRKNAASRLQVREQLIAKIRNSDELKSLEAAGGHVAWAEQNVGSNKWTVYEDGNQIGGKYENVEYLEFSPNGSRLAFFGLKGSAWHPVINGQERPSVYTGVSQTAFQPHGLGWAFRACYVQGTCTMVVNGELASMPRETYYDVSPPQYSPDGKHLGFLVQFHGKWTALVDGKAVGPPMDGYSCLGFSPHGSHFFACGKTKKRGWTYFVDGVPGPYFGHLSFINFSEDGKHYLYGGSDMYAGFAKNGTTGAVVLDGKNGPIFHGSGMTGEWVLALDASMWAGEIYGGFPVLTTFVPGHLLSGPRIFVAHLNGISDPVFDSHEAPVYAARRGKNNTAVVDGTRTGPRFDDVLTDVVFTDDRLHSAYVALRGRDFVEVLDNQSRGFVTTDDVIHHKGGYHDANGKPVKPPPPDLSNFSIGWTSLSANAAHFAYDIVKTGFRFKQYRMRRAQQTVVLDSNLQKRYSAFGISLLRFTPDERHYWYTVAGAKGKKSLVVVDGRETKLYDELTEPQLDSQNKEFSFFATQKNKILRVTIPFPEN